MAVGSNANLSPEYAVARDGRFLLNVDENSGAAPITVIINWNPRIEP
jgi:hypothetical protein